MGCWEGLPSQHPILPQREGNFQKTILSLDDLAVNRVFYK